MKLPPVYAQISINWLDIRKYNDPKLYGPTPMYLEGTFVEEKNGYLILRNPENINLETVMNHPIKKANFFCIPLSLITSIEVL